MKVLPARPWVVELLSPRVVPVTNGVSLAEINGSVRRHPSAQAFDAFDWLRAHADFADCLGRHGWQVHSTSGGDVNYTRPGKSVRDGKSAVLHEGGPLVVFTTEVPRELENVGHPTADGTGFSVSIVEFVCAYEFGGDLPLLGREIRKRFGPQGGGPPVTGRAAAVAPDFDVTLGDSESPDRLPMLPSEFWEHPVNAHILAAARARRCGPDALALNVLLRASMLVPPSFQLPPLSGGFSPINLLGCVVGRTGEGKSVSISAAADVLSVEHPWLLWDMPLGSGEGVGDIFMLDELEEGARGKKKTGRRVQNPNLHAVHFVVDEGAALVETASRKGATIIPALCKAWTGVTLGETNIAVNSRRVRALSYRVSAVINIQPTNFHRLFNTANTGTGLTGRFLFAPAADYDMPDVRGEWPGELEFPVLKGGALEGNVIAYHDDIYAEVDAAIVKANRTGGTPENVSHTNLLRARVAAIYAVWDDRRMIEPADWHVAGLLTKTSARTLNSLDFIAEKNESDLRHKQDEAKALSTVRVGSIIEQGDKAKFKGRIIERCPAAGLTRREIKNLKDSPRQVLWAALDELLAEGLMVKEGTVYKRVR